MDETVAQMVAVTSHQIRYHRRGAFREVYDSLPFHGSSAVHIGSDHPDEKRMYARKRKLTYR
jgi:hypothetical protein